MNYGGLLPKTGLATVGIGIGTTQFNTPLPIVIAAIGVGLVILGVAAVRLGFRRKKGVEQA